jgi:hypothetical protein
MAPARVCRPAVFACVVATLFAITRVAASGPADESRRQAAESFRQAQAAFARSDFAAAAAAFEQAARFQPHPSPLLNAAEAWERAGELARAAEDCDQALAMADIEPKYRTEAEKRLGEIRPRIARVDVTGPRTVTVVIDGGPEKNVPVRRWLPPGRHTLQLVDLGTAGKRVVELDLAAGEARTIDATPAPARPRAALAPAAPVEPIAQPRAPSSRGFLPTTSWIALGGAGAAALTAAVLGGLTVAAQSEFNDDPTRDAADRFQGYKTATNVALGVAAGGVVVAVVAWALAPSAPKTAMPGAARQRALVPVVRF